MARSKKQCRTGIPDAAIREAMRQYDLLRVDSDRMMALPGGYVEALPKYPTPGTAEFTRCITKWYNAYSQASMMDSWLQQIATLRGQLNAAEPILDSLTAAYTDCMKGTPA